MGPHRNPRRAFDSDGVEIPPMTIGNMRSQGVRSVSAYCQSINCGHEAAFNVDAWPDELPVPDIALSLRCSRCGRKEIRTMPVWSESSWHRSYGHGT
jgi:hypothetical protein